MIADLKGVEGHLVERLFRTSVPGVVNLDNKPQPSGPGRAVSYSGSSEPAVLSSLEPV